MPLVQASDRSGDGPPNEWARQPAQTERVGKFRASVHWHDEGIREHDVAGWPGLPETLSALLVSESRNVGLTPVADETHPPLSRARLNWVGHNYLRSATHAAANTRLVDHHTPPAAGQAWGGGGMASADGMRFVIPVATINAAYNPRYFGRQCGSTLYSWIADRFTVFLATASPWYTAPRSCALTSSGCNGPILPTPGVTRPGHRPPGAPDPR